VESFVADDGERLHLRIVGDGPPLILLHGWTSGHTIWNPFLAALAQRHRLFIPDARGHGGHPLCVDPAPDVARLARDVRNLMDHFGLERAAAVGHSMGALTLWQHIGDFGCERLTRLCLIDQSPKLVTDANWPHGIYGDFDAARSQQLIDALEQDFAEAVLRLAAHGLNARARTGYEHDSRGWRIAREATRALAPGPLIAIWRSLVAADYRDILPGITVPVLLVHGEKSNFYTAATARYLRDRLPDVALVSYEDADHSPQLLHPQRFADDLLGFLGRSPGGTR
jgi:non-heme chloroperoxidase